MTDKEFVPGLFAKAPHENSPWFVKLAISIKVKDLGNFLREKNAAGEEWVNVQVKESQGGKWYAEVDNWKPSENSAPTSQQQAPQNQREAHSGDFDDDIPF
jgi:hypothetical protein